jgi:hypothetical protein
MIRQSRTALGRRAGLAIALLGLATLPAAAQTGAESSVGYIDSAIPTNQFRLRFDAAFDSNRPTRAEFFYAKPSGLGGPGLPLPETRVDYQELTGYLEACLTPRLSGFVELPVRFLNPEVNSDHTGFSDMNFGFKYAMVEDNDQVLTFQLRVFAPTGDPHEGLGNDHVSLEPALLAYEQLTDRLALEAELRDWIPVGGTDFAGNIVRYGAGLSYRVCEAETWRVSPVVELVGWTVLDGKEVVATSPTTSEVQSAGGDTIINAKMGVRVGFGYGQEGACPDEGHRACWPPRGDFYVGYGRALTGDVWYKDIVRVEFRLRF